METSNLQELLQAARTLDAEIPRGRQSKLDPYREFIISAFKENIRINLIRDILEKRCNLAVTRENLRSWINRQPEIRKRIRKPKRTHAEAREAYKAELKANA